MIPPAPRRASHPCLPGSAREFVAAHQFDGEGEIALQFGWENQVRMFVDAAGVGDLGCVLFPGNII